MPVAFIYSPWSLLVSYQYVSIGCCACPLVRNLFRSLGHLSILLCCGFEVRKFCVIDMSRLQTWCLWLIFHLKIFVWRKKKSNFKFNTSKITCSPVTWGACSTTTIFTGPSIPPWLVDAGPSSVSEKAFLCVLLSIKCGLFVFFRLLRLWLMLSSLTMIGWCSFHAPLREATQSPFSSLYLTVHPCSFFPLVGPKSDRRRGPVICPTQVQAGPEARI